MMIRCRVFRVLLIFFFLCSQAWAADYTIRSSGGDYTSIGACLTANTVVGGDNIEVQAASPGGTITLTGDVAHFNNTDTGSSDESRIVIQCRSGDTCVMDGGLTTSSAFELDEDNDYVTIKGFTIKNYRSPGIYLNGGGDGILVQNCNILIRNDGGETTINRTGLTITGGSGTIVENCVIATELVDTWYWQSDGMIVFSTDGLIIRNNIIALYSDGVDDTGHNDNIHISYYNSNFQIYNNKLFHYADRERKQGIFAETDTGGNWGTCYIYNNLIAGGWGAYGLNIHLKGTPASGTVYLMNNTIITDDGGSPGDWDGADSGTFTLYAWNNLYYTSNGSTHGFEQIDVADIDYNWWYLTGYTTPFSVSWATWLGYGYDANGGYGNPNITTVSLSVPFIENNVTGYSGLYDHKLTASSDSTLLSGGKDLSAYFTTDIDGNTITTWHIGAYTYQEENQSMSTSGGTWGGR